MAVLLDPRIGTELAGYRIEALLGRGGMSVVYLAEHLRLKRKVALKLIAPERAGEERFRERFLRESELAARLEHPNVIPIHDAGEAEGLLYIAMRSVEGADLGALLERERRIEPDRALAILAQVASALDAAHARGLVHRDVKPRNILIASGAGGEDPDHVYVCDFGLTKHTEEGSLTESDQLIGTIDYVAPEQIENEPVDGRTDVYSLGCVLYECLTGEVPFRRDSKMALLWAHLQESPPAVTSLCPDLPAGLDAVLAKAMAKSPDERYSACRDFIAAARAELPLTEGRAAVRLSPADPPRASRTRLLLALAAVVLAAAAVAAVILPNWGGGEKGNAVPAIKANTLARFDPATNQLTATIAVGGTPAGVAVGKRAVWVANRDDGVVLKIDPKTSTVMKTLAVGGSPTGIAVGAEPEAVWVTEGPDGVVRILPYAGDSMTPFQLGLKYATAASVAEGAVWVASPTGDTLARVDPKTGEVVAARHVDGWPFWVAVGEGSVWTGNLDGTVSQVDPATNEITRAIEVRPPELAMGGAPVVAVGEGSLWVTNFPDQTVLRIDPKTGEIIWTIDVGGSPSWVAVGAGSLWVTNADDKTVLRMDPESGEVLATIPVESGSSVVSVGPSGVWIVVGALLGEPMA